MNGLPRMLRFVKSTLELYLGKAMKDDGKTYFDLTDKELKARAKLGPKEKEAVDALKTAVKALPRSICLEVDEEGLHISKRITAGSAKEVAKVRKASLEF